MTAQYVFPTSKGLFRIVGHGRRWRALREASEVARFDSAEQALDALRSEWPQARLPAALGEWRYVAEVTSLPHARLSRATSTFRGNEGGPRHSRRPVSRASWGQIDLA